MGAKVILLIGIVSIMVTRLLAQSAGCEFKPPFFHLHFGNGDIRDVNTASQGLYSRVPYSCPGDGYYSFTSFTSDCFRGDWHTIQDHTAGDAGGNMLLVNSAHSSGEFFATSIKGFKGGTTYQLGVWLMNVCKPTRKCPFPLLPNLTIKLQTPAGKTVAQFNTGDVPRVDVPRWTQHRAQFTLPVSVTELVVTFTNNNPGGCGNDFAMDDLTFRECVKPDPARVVQVKKLSLPVAKKQPVYRKEEKKVTAISAPVRVSITSEHQHSGKKEHPHNIKPPDVPAMVTIVPVPPVLKQRSNTLMKYIETTEGEILLDLYDNGEIDGDTVSIYHNNTLIVSEQRLSQKPISIRLLVNKKQPHHELVMVANNLGTIPPNTSVMMVTAKDKRHQVFISSTEQKNAKVVIVLKE